MQKKMFNVPAAYYMLVVPPGHRKHQVAIVVADAAVMIDHSDAEMELGVRVSRDPLDEIMTGGYNMRVTGTYKWFIDPRTKDRLLTPWRLFGVGERFTQPVRVDQMVAIWNRMANEESLTNLLDGKKFQSGHAEAVKIVSSVVNPLAPKMPVNYDAIGQDTLILHENSLADMRSYRSIDERFCRDNQIYFKSGLFAHSREEALSSISNAAKHLIICRDQIFVPSAPPTFLVDRVTHPKNGGTTNTIYTGLGEFDGRGRKPSLPYQIDNVSVNDIEKAFEIINATNRIMGRSGERIVFNDQVFVSRDAEHLVKLRPENFLFWENSPDRVTLEPCLANVLSYLDTSRKNIERNRYLSGFEPVLDHHNGTPYQSNFREAYVAGIGNMINSIMLQSAELVRKKREGEVWEFSAQILLDSITELQSMATSGINSLKQVIEETVKAPYSTATAIRLVTKDLEQAKMSLKLALDINLTPAQELSTEQNPTAQLQR